MRRSGVFWAVKSSNAEFKTWAVNVPGVGLPHHGRTLIFRFSEPLTPSSPPHPSPRERENDSCLPLGRMVGLPGQNFARFEEILMAHRLPADIGRNKVKIYAYFSFKLNVWGIT